ncbi:ABC transporter ATP-binding protein [bacterium]|nr:ABC transporter ATP-binding protein [candidate division CSSED10-310 bacterium]
MSESFHIIINYFKRYRRNFFLGIIGLLLVDGLQIIIPWIVRGSIDLLTNHPEDYRKILWNGFHILLISIGIGLSRFMWRYFIIGISRRIEMDLRNSFYKHLQALPYSYYDRTSVGDLMAHATNDLEAIRMMCGMAVIATLDSGLLMVASLVMMFTINPGLTGFVLIPLPVITFIVLRLGPLMHTRFRDVQARFSDISEKAQETFAGIRVVKSYVQENQECSNFKLINQTYIDDNMRLVKVWGLLHPLIWTIGGLCGVIILFAGGGRVIDGRMTIGDFVAFNSYLGILVWPMIAVGWVVNIYQRGRASLDRIYAILNLKPEIRNEPGAESVEIMGEIEFRHLSFSYNNHKPVLRDVSLKIPKGQWLAVMGPTGSSKTTLVNLISRLYDPPPGTVFIDGRDIRSITLESLREQIAHVPQQTFLFSDSISNNIRFGKDLPEDQVETLAHMARIYEDVDHFPDRFETLVGERGVTLSGGQKQRVAIARALAADAPILIFDDALSAVDTETEEAIVENIRRTASDRTVILISHRVSTAREADWIVFIEEGSIIEQGTHSQLVAMKGRYREIFEHQRLVEELEQVTELSMLQLQDAESPENSGDLNDLS